MKEILITGAAGFIGTNLIIELLSKSPLSIIGIDNFHGFYSRNRKIQNTNKWKLNKRAKFYEIDILSKSELVKIFEENDIEAIIHLAAYPGVRNSVYHPAEVNRINYSGTKIIFEIAKEFSVNKFVFASSSSVYGNTVETPWNEDTSITTFLNPYAKSKFYSELFLKKESELSKISIICLRLFSVYGPFLRPDLALNIFSDKLIKNEPISIIGSLSNSRDFTYIKDICDAFHKSLSINNTGYSIYNIGSGKPITLKMLIETLETKLNKKANLIFEERNKAESYLTFANNLKATLELGWVPKTPFDEGIDEFLAWKSY